MNGFKIENGRITTTRLGEEHGCLTAMVYIEGNGWGCGYGGYALGHFCGDKKPTYGAGAISALLRTLELDCWEQLVGTYVRVRIDESIGGKIEAIGHIYKDHWFSYEEYFFERSKGGAQA